MDWSRVRKKSGYMVGGVAAAIGQVAAQAEALKRDMAALGRQAEDMGQGHGGISDIACQTSLLALIGPSRQHGRAKRVGGLPLLPMKFASWRKRQYRHHERRSRTGAYRKDMNAGQRPVR
jgi:hypothetical protein